MKICSGLFSESQLLPRQWSCLMHGMTSGSGHQRLCESHLTVGASLSSPCRWSSVVVLEWCTFHPPKSRSFCVLFPCRTTLVTPFSRHPSLHPRHRLDHARWEFCVARLNSSIFDVYWRFEATPLNHHGDFEDSTDHRPFFGWTFQAYCPTSPRS